MEYVKILTKHTGQAQSRDRTLHALAAQDRHHSRPAPIAIAPNAIDSAIRFMNPYLLRVARRLVESFVNKTYGDGQRVNGVT